MRMRDILNILTESVAGKAYFVPEENAYVSFEDNRDADVYSDYVKTVTGSSISIADGVTVEKVVPSKTLASFYGTPGIDDEQVEDLVRPFLFGEGESDTADHIVYVPEEDAVLCFEYEADLLEFTDYVKGVSNSDLKPVSGQFRGKKVPKGTIFLSDGNKNRYEELVRPFYVYRKTKG